MLLTRPDNLKAEQHELLAKFTAACPEMTQLTASIRDFAPLLTPHADAAAKKATTKKTTTKKISGRRPRSA